LSYLIRGGRLIDPAGVRSALGDLLIVGDTIAGMGRVEDPGDAEIVDASGLIVCPGLIDMHVHLREPGFEYKETIATGTAAAAAGGFATVCAEPNTEPPVDSPERVADALDRIRSTALVKVLPKACMTEGQRGAAITDARKLKARGAIALSDDGEPVLDEGTMREALAGAAGARMLITTHCEESPRSRAVRPSPVAYAAEAELVCRDLGLLKAVPARLHFSHLSTGDSVRALAEAHARGLTATAEATPHHCLLSTDDVPADDADYKVNPPLRAPGDTAAIGVAVTLGEIPVIASDHAPHALQEKRRPWDDAPFGCIGLETTLAVMLSAFVHAQVMPLMNLLATMTCNPARILGLKSGRLKVGAPADVTLIDLDRLWVVDPREFKSKARNCPFAGWPVRGKAVGVWVNGRMAMRDGEVFAGTTDDVDAAGGRAPERSSWQPPASSRRRRSVKET
jgi:dihydroorotase